MRDDSVSRRDAIKNLAWAAAMPGIAALGPRSGIAGNPAGAVRPPVPFTVSKATTWITSPVSPDGYVDYAAALNQRLGAGVAPHDNAAVPLFQLLGPDDVAEASRDEFFRRLGIPTPTERQFQGWVEYFEIKRGRKFVGPEIEAAQKRDLQAHSAPWRPTDLPEYEEWLRNFQEPIDLAALAAARPHWFVPVVAPAGASLWNTDVAFGLGYDAGGFGGALIRRSMMRLGLGEYRLAYDDVLAALRLATHIVRGPWAVEMIFGAMMMENATEAGLVWLRNSPTNAESLRNLLDDLRELPSPISYAEHLNLTHRCDQLAHCAAIARGGPAALQDFLNSHISEQNDERAAAVAKLIEYPVDFNAAMRRINHWFDRLVTAVSRPTYPDRKNAVRPLKNSAESALERFSHPRKLLEAIAGHASPGIAMGELVGDTLGSVWVWVDMLSTEVLALQQFDHLRLAVALAIYKAEHGEYPEQLASLVPQILPDLPRDRFAAGQSLPRYRRQGPGYILYSVGENGRDNGGRKPNFNEEQGDGWDEAVVAM